MKIHFDSIISLDDVTINVTVIGEYTEKEESDGYYPGEDESFTVDQVWDNDNNIKLNISDIPEEEMEKLIQDGFYFSEE